MCHDLEFPDGDRNGDLVREKVTRWSSAIATDAVGQVDAVINDDVQSRYTDFV